MSGPVCPYCRMPFEEGGPAKIFCTACGTPHHEDCYSENGGCTVFGCSRAPADDPKLQVSQSDLHAVNLPLPSQAAPAQPAAPAPQPQYPPSMYSGPLGLSQSAAPAPATSSYGRGPLGLSAAATAPAPQVQPPPAPAPPPGTYYYPQAAPQAPVYMPPPVVYGHSPKSRSTYVVLGIFLGALGIHNFYAGYTGKAVGQLCLTVFTVGYLSLVSWIWAIIEVCIVTQDSEGMQFN